MNTLEVLLGARYIITDKEQWCQEHHAIENTGQGVDSLSPRACAWCADGAMIKAIGQADAEKTQEYHEAALTLSNVTRAIYPNADHTKFSYVAVNDGEIGNPEDAHSNILAVFDKAIERVRR